MSIKLQEISSNKCLGCNRIPGKFIKIGVLLFCKGCAKKEFPDNIFYKGHNDISILKPIEAGSKEHKHYISWLNVYKRKDDD